MNTGIVLKIVGGCVCIARIEFYGDLLGILVQYRCTQDLDTR